MHELRTMLSLINAKLSKIVKLRNRTGEHIRLIEPIQHRGGANRYGDLVILQPQFGVMFLAESKTLNSAKPLCRGCS